MGSSSILYFVSSIIFVDKESVSQCGGSFPGFQSILDSAEQEVESGLRQQVVGVQPVSTRKFILSEPRQPGAYRHG